MSTVTPEELKKIREEVLGITLTRLAELLGIPRTNYRKYEKGTYPIPEDLGQRLDEIVAEHMAEGGEPPKPKPKPKKDPPEPPPEEPPTEPPAPEEEPPKEEPKAELPPPEPEPEPPAEMPESPPPEARKKPEPEVATRPVQVTKPDLLGLTALLSAGKKVRIEIVVTLED